MVRNYKKKKADSVYNEEDMEAAIRAAREQRMSLREAATSYGLSHTALYYRLKKIKIDNEGKVASSVKHNFQSKYSSQQVFNKDQELSLVEYAVNSSKMCYGLTYKQMRVLSYEYAASLDLKMPNSWSENHSAGEDWLYGFMRRHRSLTIHKPENTSISRLTSFNKNNVEAFFDNYERALKSKNFTACQIFNLDETGVATVVQAPNIVAPRGAKQVGQAVSAERGQSITLCMIISASGNALPPVFIYPRARVNESMVDEGPPGSIVLANSPGSHWMTRNLFLHVLRHIVNHTKCNSDNPILILMDNHESHCSLDAVNYSRESGITLVTFPPHRSHKLQPLDVGVLGPFKAKTKVAQYDWLTNHPGKTISIHNLPSIVNIAFNSSFTRANIISSFKKPGLWPLNRLVFTDEDFMSSAVTDRPMPANQQVCEPVEPVAIAGCSKATNEPTQNEDLLPVPVPECSKDDNRSVLISPEQVRPYPKAPPRSNSLRGRKKGKTRILTETPEKLKLEEEQLERELKKNKAKRPRIEDIKKVKKNIGKLEESSSESEANMSHHDESSDASETFSDLETSREEVSLLALRPNDFILVSFNTKKSKFLFVGQIEDIIYKNFVQGKIFEKERVIMEILLSSKRRHQRSRNRGHQNETAST